jgi:hypothetical protein
VAALPHIGRRCRCCDHDTLPAPYRHDGSTLVPVA